MLASENSVKIEIVGVDAVITRTFRCKTVQFYAKLRESEMAEIPSVPNGAEAGER